jgi:rod shape-determining protein MreC
VKDDKRTRLLLAVLLAAAFALVTVDARSGGHSPLKALRSGGDTVFGPVERAADDVTRPVKGFFHGLGHSGADRKEIDRLKADNATLRTQVETSAAARARVAELDKLLHVASVGGFRTIPARVLTIGPVQQGSWSATIDAGALDGIRVGMTVLDGDGLVGRTVSVGRTTATVLLAADTGSSVGVRTPGQGGAGGGGQVGVATGAGPGEFTVQFFDPQAAVVPGTPLLTFGSPSGTPFVPGIPVGSIVAVRPTPGAMTRTATVKPYVDFSALETVGVVVAPPRTDPRDALAPAQGGS